MKKKILVPGGTGAMGVYLVPELLSMGYAVDVISLDDVKSSNPDLLYIKANAKDLEYMREVLKKDYDAVVDFMIYFNKEEYEPFVDLYTKNTGHYIFLSTYRVYADLEHPVRESSPRLLDVTDDKVLLNSGDYCIYKAQGEDCVRSAGGNWTVIRPAITFSKRRFQLTILEMDTVVRRMLEGKKLVLPEPAMNVRATMSWAGDVAKMIARLLLNPKTYGETYSVCTAEHNSWGEIAQMYARIGGLKYETVDTETFLDVINPGQILARQQLVYDRYFDRIMDNSKILSVTGLTQAELMPVEKGLSLELSRFPRDYDFGAQSLSYRRMDEYFSKK